MDVLFPAYDVAEKLGITPIARVPEDQVWNIMLTPQVKAFLGDITSIEGPLVTDTIEGFFPGDEVFNLNNHMINSDDGKARTRLPYITTLYKTKYGACVIKRDGVKIKCIAWFGDVFRGHGEIILITALRDRRYDGTRRSDDSALSNFPAYHPVFHKVISPEVASLEVSIYSYLPGSKIIDVTGDAEYHDFVDKPFSVINQPEHFLQLFWRAWKSKRAPGQYAVPFPDVSKHVLKGYEEIAKSAGYDFLESCPSHYHVARWFQASGYCYNDSVDAKTMSDFAQALKRIREKGTPLTRQQHSWLCVLQNLQPAELIPEEWRLSTLEDGAQSLPVIWPQDNIGLRNLWMHKAISDKGRKLVACHQAETGD